MYVFCSTNTTEKKSEISRGLDNFGGRDTFCIKRIHAGVIFNVKQFILMWDNSVYPQLFVFAFIPYSNE